MFLLEDPVSRWFCFEVWEGKKLKRGVDTPWFSLCENFHLYRKNLEFWAILPVFGYWETYGRARNEYMHFYGARACKLSRLNFEN